MQPTPAILVVLGTRPEAIKLAPVIAELRRRAGHDAVRVCSTGQHREMLDQALAWFGLRPDVDLLLMRPDQTLADLTARMVSALDAQMAREPFSRVVVQGDTTTAFCGALAAFYRRIPVAHVEAGLRTDDPGSPFPEEMNRRLVTRLADLHFAPTPSARNALLAEGVAADSIHVTGNTVIDALLQVRAGLAPERPAGVPELAHRMLLVTAHRRENHGDGLLRICGALRDVVDACDDVEVVFPIHLSPRVQGPVNQLLSGVERIHLLPPLEYPAFVWLLDRCHLVLTDSGGIQEEAPSLGKPVLVARDSTERPEGIAAGGARLVGSSRELIVEATLQLLRDESAWSAMARTSNPYGDGNASLRIADALLA